MRSLPYELNDPTDFSMLHSPRLLIGDIVIIFDADDGPGEWAQARVFAAQFNRYTKQWEYEASMQLYNIDGDDDNGLIDRNWEVFTDRHIRPGNHIGLSLPIVFKEKSKEKLCERCGELPVGLTIMQYNDGRYLCSECHLREKNTKLKSNILFSSDLCDHCRLPMGSHIRKDDRSCLVSSDYAESN